MEWNIYMRGVCRFIPTTTTCYYTTTLPLSDHQRDSSKINPQCIAHASSLGTSPQHSNHARDHPHLHSVPNYPPPPSPTHFKFHHRTPPQTPTNSPTASVNFPYKKYKRRLAPQSRISDTFWHAHQCNASLRRIFCIESTLCKVPCRFQCFHYFRVLMSHICRMRRLGI